MYRVLIVDDEAAVRRGLKNTIDWNYLGFELVGEADDGTVALDMTETLKPDVIITDICMPIMDGIEYLKKLKAMNSRAGIIILSGHDRFDFARDAIRYGAFSYILKPVDNKELVSQLLSLKEKIESENKYNIEFEKLRVLVQENRPMLKERFLNSLVKGMLNDDADILKKLEFFGIGPLDSSMAVMVADIDDYPASFDGLNEEEKQIRKFAMVEIAEKKLSNYGRGCVFSGNDRQFIIILSFEGEKSECRQYNMTFGLAEEIKSTVSSLFGFTVTIGTSKAVYSLKCLKKGYNEAQEAIRQKSWLGKDSIIFFQDVVTGNTKICTYPKEAESEVFAGISGKNTAQSLKGIESFCRYIYEFKGLELKYIHEMAIRLSFGIYHTLFDTGMSLDSIHQLIQVQAVSQFQTLDDIRGFLEGEVIKIITVLEDESKARYRHEITRAVNYINEHFNEQIELNEVAEYIHLSPYYLSRLFKKETGRNLIDYLNEVRINRAKDLIKDPALKLYEIAEKVGYRDNTYFGQMFKKYVGISPGDFRRKD